MSFSKAQDLLRLAQMAASRRGGVSLEDICVEFGVSHRTAQRMTEALDAAFANVTTSDAEDRRRYWRLDAPPSERLQPRQETTIEALEIAARAARDQARLRHARALEDLRDGLLARLTPRDATRSEADAEAVLASLGQVMRPGPTVALRPDLSEAQSMLASVLLQAGDDRGFLAWFGELPGSARNHPGVWSALGRFAASVDQPEVAARCFWEAVGRNPNHHQANYQLGQVLTQLDREPEAKPFLERSRKINRYTTRVTAAWASERLGELKIVSEVAEELGLIWEAYGWALWAREKGTEESEPQAWAVETVDRLAPRLASLEPARTLSDANPVTTIDLADLPLPNWADESPGHSVTNRINDVDVSFEDQAHRAGVRFRYLNGGDPTNEGPGFMFEMTGGGGAAVEHGTDLVLARRQCHTAGTARSGCPLRPRCRNLRCRQRLDGVEMLLDCLFVRYGDVGSHEVA